LARNDLTSGHPKKEKHPENKKTPQSHNTNNDEAITKIANERERNKTRKNELGPTEVHREGEPAVESQRKGSPSPVNSHSA
jgi:hypothetical protein